MSNMEEFVYGKPNLNAIPRAFFVELLKSMQKAYLENQDMRIYKKEVKNEN